MKLIEREMKEIRERADKQGHDSTAPPDLLVIELGKAKRMLIIRALQTLAATGGVHGQTGQRIRSLVAELGDPDAVRQFERELTATGLRDHLLNESERLMGEAMGRRSSAKVMRGATGEELREAKRTAEMMMGHKCRHITTSREAAAASADIDERIAEKLEAQAKQFEAWAMALPAPPLDEKDGR